MLQLMCGVTGNSICGWFQKWDVSYCVVVTDNWCGWCQDRNWMLQLLCGVTGN